MRNKTLYPKIVLLDSSGHCPTHYVQVTEAEAADLEKRQWDYHGSFGSFEELEYIYQKERQISKDEVDLLPKDIPEYTEYE